MKPGTRALTLAPLLAAVGCVPWVASQTAETVPASRIEHGPGVALVAPPGDAFPPLPVPQYRVTLGLGADTDVALAYALPITFHARVKRRLVDRERLAGAAAVGFGLHGLPEVAGVDATYWFPFATATFMASTRGAGPPAWAALRLVAPFHAGEDFAATLWVAPQVGIELGDGTVRWGPELGAIIPTLHPRDTQVVLAAGLRWSPRR